MARLKAVFPISNDDLTALPVKDIPTAVRFYTAVLGFTPVSQSDAAATLKRDDVQIGLVRQANHDPAQAGSCYFDVSDVEALRLDLEAKGGQLSPFRVDEHGGKHYRVFFLREDDDGYCFCFGQPV